MREPLEKLKQKKSKFAERLLAWHAAHRRNFPWRRTRDPFKILLAEAMLRKTTARQVTKLYQRFLLKYPSPSSLLNAPLKELMDGLRPLGIYRVRAAQLKAMAKILVQNHRGRVPKSEAKLVALPGVNKYVANAVLCLAYGKSVPFLDTNSARVLQRAFGIKTRTTLPQDDFELWDFAAKLIPPSKAREFNLALLDLGATVCTASKANCYDCPLARFCKSYLGREEK
jgi:A/G-specific adenine glycosylase